MAERRDPRRIALGVAGVVLLLAVVAAFALYYLMTRSLPVTEGDREVAGLSAEVQVIRDPAGVPHILASSDYDAYVAAGYVHAQDRLWQMDILRRYGQGRLAEVLGARALPIDRMMRTVGLRQIADSLWTTVSEQTRNILRAYAAGVNACLREMDGRYPLEFDVLQYTPEEWTPQNSLLVVRLMGWELALSWWVDLTMDQLRRRLGEEKARELFPAESDGRPPVLPPDLAHTGGIEETSPLTHVSGDVIREGLHAAQALFGSAGSAVGSNAWAVTRERSARGGALLANDPHLLHMQPARFYIMHMAAPGLNVAGATIPGAPGVVIGHNGHIAWGMTNLMADDVDFFVEDVNLPDSTYRVGGRLLPLDVRTDSIFVRDSLPVVLTLYRTVHGPVITDSYPLDGVLRPPARFRPPPAVSIRWAGQDASDELLALFRANRARDWREFVAAYASFGVPAQNLIFGDTQGNIGYTVAGRVPQRAAGVSPLLRNDGTLDAAPWRGYVPYEDLPRAFNPPGDAVASANNRPVEDLPYHISSLWEGDGRIRRIREMLREQSRFSASDFRLMQMDVRSVTADTIRTAMIEALRAWPTRPVLMTRVMNMLARWDCRMHVSSVEASLFNAAWVRLLHNTLEDELGPVLLKNYTFLSNLPTRVLPRLLSDTSATVFDDVRTPRRETRQHILIRSLTEAVTGLRRRFGPDMRRWEWGELHRVTFRHPLGEVQPLDQIFNIGPIAVGGNNTTVSNGEYALSAPYDVSVGSALRFIADMASPDSSYIILPTGQSGQVFSEHYADQTALWQSGAMHRLVINREAILSAPWKRLLLRP